MTFAELTLDKKQWNLLTFFFSVKSKKAAK